MRDDEENIDAFADFLSIVSHDVKNGLNVINLGAHQISSMKGVDPEAAARLKRVAEMLTRASRRMGDLMRDIVDLARIESGQLTVETKMFRVADAVKSAVDAHAREAEEKKVVVDVSIPGELFAHGDSERIANVVAIFLSNAIRVSPDEGRVQISASANNDRVRVEVRDFGPGIPEAELESLFVRPTPKRGQKRTLGRGLPLARGVLLAQNGTLDVDTRPNEGAAFTFSLPIANP